MVHSKNSSNLDSISWLQRIDQVVLKDNLNRSWELPSWSILWHFLDGDHLRVLVYAVSVLCGQGVFFGIPNWEGIVAFSRCVHTPFSNLIEVELVVVILDGALFSGLAVMDRGLDLRLHHGHSCDDTLHLHELVYKIGFQTTRSNIVLTEISFEVHVVDLNFFWELGIGRLSLLLFRVLLTPIILQVLHVLCQGVLENLDRINWIFSDELT